MLAKKNTILLSLLFAFLGPHLMALAGQEEGNVEARQSFSAIGTLMPQYKSMLGSVVSGRVDAVFVDVGDFVTKGQPLLALDQTFFEIAVSEAQTAVGAATIERDDALRNLDRMKKLFEKPEGQTPSISQKRFEDAQTRYEQAQTGQRRAEEALKKAKKNLEEATIRAPYDGVVTKRLACPGEPINATPVTKLLEIMSLDELYVEFSIPQVHMAFVKRGIPVLLGIEGTLCHDVEAKIDCIFPDIDEKTRSVKCRATIKNPERTLHPGALVHVVIPYTNNSSVCLCITEETACASL